MSNLINSMSSVLILLSANGFTTTEDDNEYGHDISVLFTDNDQEHQIKVFSSDDLPMSPCKIINIVNEKCDEFSEWLNNKERLIACEKVKNGSVSIDDALDMF